MKTMRAKNMISKPVETLLFMFEYNNDYYYRKTRRDCRRGGRRIVVIKTHFHFLTFSEH